MLRLDQTIPNTPNLLLFLHCYSVSYSWLYGCVESEKNTCTRLLMSIILIWACMHGCIAYKNVVLTDSLC